MSYSNFFLKDNTDIYHFFVSFFVALNLLYFGSFCRIRFWAKSHFSGFRSLWSKNIVLTKLNMMQ